MGEAKTPFWLQGLDIPRAPANQDEYLFGRLRDLLDNDPEFATLYREAAEEQAWDWGLFAQPSLFDSEATDA